MVGNRGGPSALPRQKPSGTGGLPSLPPRIHRTPERVPRREGGHRRHHPRRALGRVLEPLLPARGGVLHELPGQGGDWDLVEKLLVDAHPRVHARQRAREPGAVQVGGKERSFTSYAPCLNAFNALPA